MPILLYMGCSDVSECEHIYGQILTTPFCVYRQMVTLHEQEYWILMRSSCEIRL